MGNEVKVVIRGKNETKPAVQAASADLLSLNEVCAKVGEGLKHLAELYIVEKLFELGKESLNSAEEMAKLSQKTGIAADELSGLMAVAKLSDISAESFEKSLRKLSSTLSDAAAGNDKAVEALRSVGVAATDSNGKTVSLSTSLQQLAGRFSQFKDGPEKAAAAMRIFGKAGTDMIPMLNEGAEGFQRLLEQVKALGIPLSREDAEAAQAFNDQLKLLSMGTESMVRNLVMGLLPALMSVAQAMTNGIGGMEAMRKIGEILGDVVKAIATVFLAAGVAIEWCGAKLKTFAEGMGSLAAGDFSGAAESLKEFVGVANDSYSELARNQWSSAMDSLWGKHPFPTLGEGGAGDAEIKRKNASADALAKQRMQNEIENEKLGAAFAKSMNDLRLKNLEETYKLGLIPVKEYFDKKRALEEDSIKAEIWAAQRELEVQEEWSKKAPKPEERLAAQQKMNELTERETVLQAQLYALQGKVFGGDEDPMMQRVRNMQIAQAEAERVGQRIDSVYSDLSNAETRLQMQVETYKITGTEAEQQLNILRAEAANKLAAITEQYGELAKASGDPKLTQHADELNLKLDQLRISANSVRDAVAHGLTGGFTSFFETMRNSGNAAKAFTSFADSIIADIARIVERMIAMWALQKAMGFLFPSASGAVASAGGAGAAAGSMGGFSNFAGDAEFSIPFMAEGGPISSGQPAFVGERGIELFVPETSGTVIPHNLLNGGGAPQSNVQLNVINQGSPKSAEASQPSWNEQMKQWHMQLHLDDMTNSGPLSRGMAGAF